MSWLSDSTELVPGGWLSSAYAGHGVRGDAVPSTGSHGAALIFDSLTLPADAAKEYRMYLTALPSGLTTLQIGEDTSITADGANGTYTGGIGDMYEDGALLGQVGFTLVLGVAISSSGPRLAVNPRNAEVMALLLDGAGIPYAARRQNGALINIHPVEGAMLGRALTDGGDMLLIV